MFRSRRATSGVIGRRLRAVLERGGAVTSPRPVGAGRRALMIGGPVATIYRDVTGQRDVTSRVMCFCTAVRQRWCHSSTEISRSHRTIRVCVAAGASRSRPGLFFSGVSFFCLFLHRARTPYSASRSLGTFSTGIAEKSEERSRRRARRST